MATFTLTPDFVYEETLTVSVLATGYENEAEQRRLKWKGARRNPMLLRFINRSRVDYEYVRDFFLARNGQFESFNWVSKIDGVSYLVRFVEKSFRLSWSRFNAYNFEFSVKEVTA